ncbi:MAG: AbrB/MazE/SpoVT family DNA-binding domain-containing protein [Coriobacteriaceae bacterium]|jgi:AbrB family looped-hinge helix DNA binding protein|nr:MAG: AbrB/MazE/SpoVT family DNA-binding domain-containing protein [Coriobacteriaceae bacterium]
MSADVLTVSSKGQVMLPAKLRKELAIQSGDKLAVYASGDVIMLKKIQMPTAEEFRTRLDEAREWAKSVGYQKSDVSDVIKTVRAKRRA